MVNIKPRPRRPLPERPVIIQSGDLTLEGLFIRRAHDETWPVVLASPHPQFGGNMDSPVLNEMAYSLAQQGQTSLRFNYRGVGASQGSYAEGKGELEDLKAAVEFLLETLYEEKRGPYAIAGYSFGAVLGFELAKTDPQMMRLLMVAPPILNHDFSGMADVRARIGILVGAKDTICPVEPLQNLLQREREKDATSPVPELHVINHASHYFARGLSDLGIFAANFLREGRFQHAT